MKKPSPPAAPDSAADLEARLHATRDPNVLFSIGFRAIQRLKQLETQLTRGTGDTRNAPS